MSSVADLATYAWVTFCKWLCRIRISRLSPLSWFLFLLADAHLWLWALSGNSLIFWPHGAAVEIFLYQIRGFIDHQLDGVLRCIRIESNTISLSLFMPLKESSVMTHSLPPCLCSDVYISVRGCVTGPRSRGASSSNLLSKPLHLRP